MSNEQRINEVIDILDIIEKFVSLKMPGSAVLSPELREIRRRIKELKKYNSNQKQG